MFLVKEFCSTILPAALLRFDKLLLVVVTCYWLVHWRLPYLEQRNKTDNGPHTSVATHLNYWCCCIVRILYVGRIAITTSPKSQTTNLTV